MSGLACLGVLLGYRLSAIEEREPPAAVDVEKYAAESIGDGRGSALAFEDGLAVSHEPHHLAVSTSHRVVPGPAVGHRLGEEPSEEPPHIGTTDCELSRVGAEDGGVVDEQVEHTDQVASSRAAVQPRQDRVDDGLGRRVVRHRGRR